MIAAQTRILDIKPMNRVKTVQKMGNGDLQVTQHLGDVFTVSKDDPVFQQWIIYSVLAEL